MKEQYKNLEDYTNEILEERSDLMENIENDYELEIKDLVSKNKALENRNQQIECYLDNTIEGNYKLSELLHETQNKLIDCNNENVLLKTAISSITIKNTNLEEQIANSTAEIKVLQEKFDTSKRQLKIEKSKAKKTKLNLKCFEKEISELTNKINDLQNENTKLSHSFNKYKNEHKELKIFFKYLKTLKQYFKLVFNKNIIKISCFFIFITASILLNIFL